MRMRVSIFTPKAFSIRSAMVPERSEWPFRKVESVSAGEKLDQEAPRERRSLAV